MLKRLVDVLSEYEDAFLHLHLTDNENVGVECAYLGQTAESAELLPDGSMSKKGFTVRAWNDLGTLPLCGHPHLLARFDHAEIGK